ncbi:AB-hydrolase YheT [Phlebopus sp. FC_14]|nr:AB-hydrolase YheT [Phlebopus sp. FC_14]
MNSLPWTSSRKTEVVFPSSPVLVATKEQDTGVRHVSLREFIEQRCPSLIHHKFQPAWWLPNGHLQTLYCVVGDFSQRDKVTYKRAFLRLRDGGTLGLDFTPVNDGHLRRDTPIVVVTHGLTGGSHESYVRAILAPACLPISEGGLGYRAVVVNFRGCAGVPITSPQLYSAGHTDDLRQAMYYISRIYPDAPLLGLSFSLGANVMTRYVAEEGKRCRLKSACVLACPWDLMTNTTKLCSTFIGRHLYSRGMGQNLVNVLKRHLTAFSQNPDHAVAKAAALAAAMSWPTIGMFDQTFTRIGGGSSPPWPFASASAYYEYASSHKVIGDVRIPFLAIGAADDPVVQDVPINPSGNDWVVMALTSHGGHLGWFEPDDGWGKVRRWVRLPVLEWLRATAEDFIQDGLQHQELRDVNGFLTEVGRENLGCMVIDGELIIASTEGEAGMMAGL